MRVLLVTGPMEGGMRRHVEALLGGLPGVGVECGLAGPVAPTAAGVDWIDLPLSDAALSAVAPRSIAALSREWRQGRWELVHAHGYKAAVLAGIVSLITAGFRYVATFHNLCPPLGLGAQVLMRAAAGRARRQIAVSGAVLESLAAAGIPTPRSVVIPNGVDRARFETLPDREQARRALGLGEEWVVLFLGRLTAEKGVGILTRAACMLHGRTGDWSFLVTGEGPLRGELARAVRSEAMIHLLGEREDIPALMAACDAVVVPSLREGQSLVALEAMAAGRPLVVSDVGGLAELARASGAAWVVPPGDAEALAAALEGLRAQPGECAARLERGRAYVRDMGDWSQMVGRVAELYREAIGKP